MIASNMSGRAPYQCDVLTAIERRVLIYREIGKNKMVSEYGLSEIL